ncbi:MAG: hypothetical protein ACJA00_004879 [Myxococcota bacterium]
MQERHGIQDTLDEGFVLATTGGVTHEAEVPIVCLIQVGKAAVEEGTHVIERGCRVEVGLDEARWIWSALVSGAIVDVVASVRRDLNTIDDLGPSTARFRVLTRHSGKLDHGNPGAPRQYQAHLKQNAQLGLDGLHVAIAESLCAVASLEQEASAQTYIGEM